MTRLIDADKLYPDCLTKEGTLAISQSQIANAPTVSFMISPDYVTELQNLNKELIKQLEEAERPQGEWIKHEWGYSCSVCGVSNDYAYDNNIHKFTDYFCPNCGAKMDEEEE